LLFFNTEISPSFHLHHNCSQIIVLFHLARIWYDIINQLLQYLINP
jgi:hypothetical protein